MQTVKIEFTKIEVQEFEKKGSLPVRFHYKTNGAEKFVEKPYGYVKEEPMAFAEDLVAEVKNKCRKNAKAGYGEEGILAGYVNIQMEEHTVEQIANALKHIRDRIRNIKAMAASENYMKQYIEVKGLVMEL